MMEDWPKVQPHMATDLEALPSFCHRPSPAAWEVSALQVQAVCAHIEPPELESCGEKQPEQYPAQKVGAQR